MSYCTKCGKQNPETSKFCTGCGAVLVSKVQPVISSSTSSLPPPFYEAAQPSANNKNTTTLLLSTILLLGVATAAYFIFFNKKKDTVETTTTNATDQSGNTKSADTTTVAQQESEPTVNSNTDNASITVPLVVKDEEASLAITENETNAVSETLRNFYQCENDEDISCLLNHYEFPVNKYYQINNASYEKLHLLFTESFTEKLVYHNINIKWEYCTVQKSGNGYKAVLYADFNFRRSAAPEEDKSRSIQINIFMNSNYKITDIYEGQ